MKKLLMNTLIIILLSGTLLLILMNPNLLLTAVNRAVLLWATRLFPILFPFYIITVLFIKFGVAQMIGDLLSPLSVWLFRIKPVAGFVILLGMLAGNPQSAVMISELYQNQSINKAEAEHLIKYAVFTSPLYCLGTIGILYFQNLSVGIIVLTSHLVSNFLLGIILRFRSPFTLTNPQINLKDCNQPQTKEPIGVILSNIIQKGLNIMFMICGYMIFFSIVIELLKQAKLLYFIYLLLTLNEKIPLSYDLFSALFMGIFELTTFVDTITKLSLNLRLVISLITAFVSFGGLSIHAQIHSILNQIKIPYFTFLRYRLYQMAISACFAYLLHPLLYRDTLPVIKVQYVSERTLLLISLIGLILLFIYLLKIDNDSHSHKIK